MIPVRNVIFSDITQEEYGQMQSCGGLRTAAYEKDAVLFRTGDKTKEFGIVLEGKVHIENIDLWGNRVILHNLTESDAFAETYAFCGVPLLVDVSAAQASKILFLNIGVLLSPENGAKPWYFKLTRNLLLLSTQKNLAWSNRIFCMTAKGIRAKAMTFLSAEAVRHGRNEFRIAFDRQQMADYLNVERTALSKELAKMHRDGILDYHKNYFRLHRTENV